MPAADRRDVRVARPTCGRCGARLAADNRDKLCSPCSPHENGQRPPSVPADFWDHPDMQAALATRHMGRVIRAYREHPHHGRRGPSQDDVATWSGYTQGWISQTENGPPVNQLDRLVFWAEVLGVPQRHLWFSLPGAASHDERRHDALEEERAEAADPGGAAAPRPRPLAQQIAAGGLGQMSDGIEPTAAAADLAGIAERTRWLQATNMDDTALEQLHRLVHQITEIYEATAAQSLYDHVARQRNELDDLLRGHQSPVHRSELLLISGRLTVLLAHLAFDLGSTRLADAYAAEAKTIGEVSGDQGMRAHACSTLSFLAYCQGRYETAAAHAEEALRAAGPTPEGVQAAVHLARAHARLGNTRVVDEAVARAFDLRVSWSMPDTPEPFLAREPHDTARIAGNDTTVYLSLGDPGRVSHYVEMALPALVAAGARAGGVPTRFDGATARPVGLAPGIDPAATEIVEAMRASDPFDPAIVARRGHEVLTSADRWRDVPALNTVADQLMDGLDRARPAETTA